MNRRSLSLLWLVSLLGWGNIATAQTPPEPPPEGLAQLDFWVGEWTVAWTDAEGERHEGTNAISRTLDGKVLHERFSAPSMDYRGESFSVFDRRSGQWKQTWVDNAGTYLDFVGRPEGDGFIFSRTGEAPDGSARENRMIFHSISEKALIWDWEERRAGEGEWKRLWRLEYTRRS